SVGSRADGEGWALQLREALHLGQRRTNEDLKGHERGHREARQAKGQLQPLVLALRAGRVKDGALARASPIACSPMGRGESRESERLSRLELHAADMNSAQRLEQRLDQVVRADRHTA